jgi:hypothetical protein
MIGTSSSLLVVAPAGGTRVGVGWWLFGGLVTLAVAVAVPVTVAQFRRRRGAAQL